MQGGRLNQLIFLLVKCLFSLQSGNNRMITIMFIKFTSLFQLIAVFLELDATMSVSLT